MATPWWRRAWSWLIGRLRRERAMLAADTRQAERGLRDGARQVTELVVDAGERIHDQVLDAGERIGDEVRAAGERIEAEVRGVGERILDVVDDLPIIGHFFSFQPVVNQYYGHGAFMGAAPKMLADPKWRRILMFLMPDVFEEVREASKEGKGAAGIIPMFENNPVACAFGSWHAVRTRRDAALRTHANDLSGMEWDVYLDSELIEAWEKAVAAGDAAARKGARDTIVRTMVIAHASTADVMQEAAGVSQYEDVRTTRKTRMGGVQADAWLDLFGRALELAEAPDLDRAIAAMRPEERRDDCDACERYTFVNRRSPSFAVDQWQRLSGQPHLAVLLEMKSLRSTPALLREIVSALNEQGILVRAVCAFLPEEIRDVSLAMQRLGDETLPGPREIRFFHFAGDLQKACDAGGVPRGQGLLFNGASLLLRTNGSARPYCIHDAVIDAIEEYRVRFGLDVGIYVQEHDCDGHAAALLSELTRDRPETFALGFAWGGLCDEAAIEWDGEDRRGLGAQGLLAFLRGGAWRLPTSPRGHDPAGEVSRDDGSPRD